MKKADMIRLLDARIRHAEGAARRSTGERFRQWRAVAAQLKNLREAYKGR